MGNRYDAGRRRDDAYSDMLMRSGHTSSYRPGEIKLDRAGRRNRNIQYGVLGAAVVAFLAVGGGLAWHDHQRFAPQRVSDAARAEREYARQVAAPCLKAVDQHIISHVQNGGTPENYNAHGCPEVKPEDRHYLAEQVDDFTFFLNRSDFLPPGADISDMDFVELDTIAGNVRDTYLAKEGVLSPEELDRRIEERNEAWQNWDDRQDRPDSIDRRLKETEIGFQV